MKLYRFIGEKEKARLLNGEILENYRNWSDYYDTNSVGICFFAYNRTNDLRKIITNVLDEWGFAGIVKADYIVEIDVPKARKAWGWYSGGKRTEYNLTSYSLADVKSIHKVKSLPMEEWYVTTYNYYTYGAERVF